MITNEELYKRTKVTPWSLTICKRRLSWFGHLLRLSSETPAKRSLKAFVKTWKRSVGRPKTTWLRLILNDISRYSNINLSGDKEKDLESLENICEDRKDWLKTVDCIMSSKNTKMQWWWGILSNYLPLKFVNFLKSRLIFNIFYCFWMFVNKLFTYLTYAYLKK